MAFLSLLPTYSWKSLQGCQPEVSFSLCPPLSDAESLFHADHVTGVLYFRLTLNDLGSFANTESNNWFAYSRPSDLSVPSVGQTVERIPTAYGGKAKRPSFQERQLRPSLCTTDAHTPKTYLHVLWFKMTAHCLFQFFELIPSTYHLTGSNSSRERSELLLQFSHIRE